MTGLSVKSGLGEVPFINGIGVARILATSFKMRFLPPPTNGGNSAGDGLLYLPGLSLATPQYSRRIK